MLSFLIKTAYRFWPELYKKRFFKSLKTLNTNNFRCEPELLYLQSVLKKDSVFIDIGANKGIYLYQAEKIITTGKIIGFEPNEKMVSFASHLFPNAKIYPLAISSKKGISILNIPKKGNNFQDTRASLEALGDDVMCVEINTITLDEWVKNEKLNRIDVVKIDVEGHEWNAIKGSENILKTIRPIFIIEIELRHATYPIETIFTFIENCNYTVFYFDRKKLQLTPFDYSLIGDFQKDVFLNNFNLYVNNFIFIPNTI